MRATATSCTKSPRLVQVRTAPPAVELAELSFGTGPLPISAWRTAPSDPDTMQWAHGYSGCIGVSMNGVQPGSRSEEHTSELQSQSNLVCRLLLEKKKKIP